MNLAGYTMKEKTIYALGFFDGVHLGHQALLRACRALAKDTGVRAGAVTFSSSPEALISGEAPRLINTVEDRRRLLETYGMETVLELPFDRALMTMPWQAFIRMLRDRHAAAGFVCGRDFRFGHLGRGNADLLRQLCREQGLPCVVVEDQILDDVRISSTHIRRLLEEGNMEAAVRFLGHPHILSGQVVSGRQLGRSIGVPTANLQLPQGAVCPRLGVYAAMAAVDGQRYPAVTNIGTRPTVGGHHITVEPWILNFSGDLYGRILTLELHRFLRPERKFDSLEEMKAEIQKNAGETLEFFRK